MRRYERGVELNEAPVAQRIKIDAFALTQEQQRILIMANLGSQTRSQAPTEVYSSGLPRLPGRLRLMQSSRLMRCHLWFIMEQKIAYWILVATSLIRFITCRKKALKWRRHRWLK